MAKLIIFHRDETFYATEYPDDYSDWQAEADRNPGTLKITDVSGKVLWRAPIDRKRERH